MGKQCFGAGGTGSCPRTRRQKKMNGQVSKKSGQGEIEEGRRVPGGGGQLPPNRIVEFDAAGDRPGSAAPGFGEVRAAGLLPRPALSAGCAVMPRLVVALRRCAALAPLGVLLLLPFFLLTLPLSSPVLLQFGLPKASPLDLPFGVQKFCPLHLRFASL